MDDINVPDTLEMHGANLDHVPGLFALQDAISSASGHTSNIEKFGAVDHMVIYIEELVVESRKRT